MNVGRPKDLEKNQRILNAAKRLFLKCGYHGSSMKQIADEAGVTKLTVYNHFQDKANLFTCAIEKSCEESIHACPNQLHAQSNFQQEFIHICELALNISNLPEAIKLEHLLLELAAEQNPLALQFYNASHQKMCLVWQDFFQHAIAFNFIQSDAVDQQTQLILSLLLGHRHHEVLLGIRAVPTAAERHRIILQSIELFMLKYQKSA